MGAELCQAERYPRVGSELPQAELARGRDETSGWIGADLPDAVVIVLGECRDRETRDPLASEAAGRAVAANPHAPFAVSVECGDERQRHRVAAADTPETILRKPAQRRTRHGSASAACPDRSVRVLDEYPEAAAGGNRGELSFMPPLERGGLANPERPIRRPKE